MWSPVASSPQTDLFAEFGVLRLSEGRLDHKVLRMAW